MSIPTLTCTRPVFLASDLHLSEHTPRTQARFIEWLNTINQSDVFLLGDIFDAWIGDDVLAMPIGWLQELCQALKTASQTNQLYFLHGNRDFLVGEKFAQHIGAKLLPESIKLTVGDNSYLVCHGDHLCTDDVAYMAFRQQARNPQWQQQMLALTIGERIQLAQKMRLSSEQTKQMTALDIMDVNLDTVANYLTEHGVNRLIHGHTHRPGYYPISHNDVAIHRWVLSDWELDHEPHRANIARVDPQGVALVNLL